jgi:MATE family multidrug resistance protein
MRIVLKEARATLALAVPIAFGSAGQIIMGVLDSVMIGAAGPVPLAASSFGGSVFNFFYLAGLGLLLSVSVLVSKSHGAKQPRACALWLRHGLALAAGTALLGMLLMCGFGLRLELFGQPPELITEVRPFFFLMALSLLPALAFLVLRQYSESLGMPWLPMVIIFASVGLNAALNWVLIYGNLGMPALGLTGAGISTLAARCATVVALAGILHHRMRHNPAWPWSIPARQIPPAPLSRGYFRELLTLGLPCAGQLLFEVGAFTAAAVMMGWLGTTALAAHQIALSCCSLTFMAPLGLATAASMRISRALGAGQREEIRAIGLGTLGMSCLIMGAFAAAFILCGVPVARCFIDDPSVVSLAARLLIVASLFQIFDGTQVVGAGCLRGLADVKVPTLITGVAYWCMAIPVSYLLGVRAGSPLGVWWGLAAGLAAAAALLSWRFLRLSHNGTRSG